MIIVYCILFVLLLRYLCRQGVPPEKTYYKKNRGKAPRRKHHSLRRGRSSRYVNKRRQKKWAAKKNA